MKTDRNLLKVHYKAACNDYAYELMRQWELNVDDCWWAADEAGGIWCFMQGEHAINMQEIIFCMDNDVTLSRYLAWQDYILTCNDVGLPHCNLKNFVNNNSIYAKETLNKLLAMREELEKATAAARKGEPF